MPGPAAVLLPRPGREGTAVGRRDGDGGARVARQGPDAFAAGEGEAVARGAKAGAKGLAGGVLPGAVGVPVHRRTAEPAPAGPRTPRPRPPGGAP
ncbi:hypothetical protein ACIQV2_21800 [Streptomyces globosus]|uniref:hypothetical protein n=1 Tax=Streptomyces globosus TaxID=68209 RepID=UPI00382742B0